MFEANEIFVFFISTGILGVTIFLFRKLILISSWRILLAAFILYYLSTIFTIVEGFFLPNLMNFLEHLCRALFPGMVFLWCLHQVRRRPLRGDQP